MFEMISAGLQIFGAISGASKAAKQAKAEAQAAQQAAIANAAVARDNATRAREQAGIAQDQGNAMLQDTIRNATVSYGSLLSNIGSSGISTTEGSALEVLSYSAGQMALDAQRVKYKTDLQVRGYNQRADDFERDASLMIQGGNAAYARGMDRADDIMTAGWINAGSAAFGLAGKFGWGSPSTQKQYTSVDYENSFDDGSMAKIFR